MNKDKPVQEDGERARKYISFREIPPLAKTRRWYIEDKAGQPFAIIKWYGGWRKYVCYFQGDSFCDQDCLRLIAKFLEEVNRGWRKAQRESAKVLDSSKRGRIAL